MNISTVILIERLLRRLRTAVIGLLLCFTACFATQSSALTLNCPAACAGILSISGCAAITQRGWPPGATVKCSCANRTFTGSPGSTDTYQETYSAPKGIELLPSTAGRVYSGNNNFDIEPYSVTTTSLSCNWTASGQPLGSLALEDRVALCPGTVMYLDILYQAHRPKLVVAPLAARPFGRDRIR